jgi:hypothetical protein
MHMHLECLSSPHHTLSIVFSFNVDEHTLSLIPIAILSLEIIIMSKLDAITCIPQVHIRTVLTTEQAPSGSGYTEEPSKTDAIMGMCE